MTEIKIKDHKFEAELIEVDTPPPPENSSSVAKKDYYDVLQSNYDIPFKDEVFIRLSGPSQPTKFYVARINSPVELDKLDIKPGAPIEMGGLTGSVVRIIDEDNTYTPYRIDSLEVQFGFNTTDGVVPIEHPEEFGLSSSKQYREKIIEKLGIKVGDSVPGTQLDNLMRPEGPIEKIKKDHDIFNVELRPMWKENGKSIQLTLLITPPARELLPVLHGPSGEPLADEALATEISSYFNKPLTPSHLAKGMEKMEESFKTNPQYSLDGQGVFYNAKGELELHLRLMPLPKEVEFRVQAYDRNNNPIELPADKTAPSSLLRPFNEANMEKNLEALQEYYGNEGYFSTIVPGPIEDSKELFGVILTPPPHQIELTGENGPSEEELQKMFFVEGHDYITSLSMKGGFEALGKWYEKKGMMLSTTQSEDKARIDGDVLHLTAHPVIFDHVEIIYNKGGKIAEMGEPQEKNVESEFEQVPQAGEVLDTHSLERAIARITQNYPLALADRQNPYEIVSSGNRDNPDLVTVRVNLVDMSPAITASGGGAATPISYEDKTYWGGTASGGGSYRLKDGKRLSGSFAYSGDAVDQILQGSTSLSIPWIDSRGTTLTFGGYGLAVLNAAEARAGETSGYNHLAGAFTQFDIPFRKHSPWSVITAVKIEGVIDPAEGFEALWGKPDIGLAYGRGNTMASVAGGPRVSSEGQVYGEVTGVAGEKIPLTEDKHLHVDLQAKGGIRAGEITDDQMYHGSDMLGTYGGFRDEIGTAHAGTRADLVYDVALRNFLGGAKVLGVGAGVSADMIQTPEGASSRVGTGLRFDLPLLGGATILIGPAIEQQPGGQWSDPTVGLTITVGF